MKFSYFKKKVNPDKQPYYLVGFGKTREPKEDFFGLEELWLKICWIAEANENIVFITLDTLYFSKDFTDSIFHALTEKYNLKREQIIFNASHTHSAPNISVPNWDNINIDYRLKIEQLIYEGVEHCSKNLKEGSISFQKTKPEKKLFINRRKRGFSLTSPLKKTTQRLPNNNVEIDESVRIITLYNKEHAAEVIIYNVACHPVFNRSLKYSSDFVGVTSSSLEKHVDMALFLQGFSGDIRTNFYVSLSFKTILALLFNNRKFIKRNILLTLKLLINRSIFIPYTKKAFHTLTQNLSNTILESYKNETKLVSLHIKTTSFDFLLKSETGNTQQKITTTITRLDKYMMIAIPAEVNSSYYRMLKEAINDDLFLLGCSYDMIGYLPHANELEEGGYEVDSYTNYGWDSRLSKTSLSEYATTLVDSCLS